MKINLIRKLTSRKFLITLITAITGIITLFIGENEVVQIVAGAAMVIVPTIVYCVMEGVIDAESVGVITDVTADAAEKLGADENTVDVIEQIGAVGKELVSDDSEE